MLKNFCPDLFHGFYIERVDSRRSRISNCCLQEDRNMPTTTISFDSHSLVEARNYYRTSGELPKSCSPCIEIEKANGVSRRKQLIEDQPYKFDLEKPKLKKIHYNCENICNLKCIICSSFNSSAWLQDEIKLGLPIKSKGKVGDCATNKTVFNLDFTDLEVIAFNGGEPLATDDHLELLEHAIIHGNSYNIVIEYNTNATFSVTDRVKDIWSQFKHVSLYASIDGTEEQFEYVRYPANWYDVTQKLDEYRQIPNVNVSIGATIGIHNIFYADKLIKWCKDNNFFLGLNYCLESFSLKNYPIHLQSKLHEYLESLDNTNYKNTLLDMTNLIEGNYTRDLNPFKLLNKLDTIRNVSWKVSLERLYNLDPDFFDKH